MSKKEINKLKLRIRISHQMALASALDLVYTMALDDEWMKQWNLPDYSLDEAIRRVADSKHNEGVTEAEIREAWNKLQD